MDRRAPRKVAVSGSLSSNIRSARDSRSTPGTPQQHLGMSSLTKHRGSHGAHAPTCDWDDTSNINNRYWEVGVCKRTKDHHGCARDLELDAERHLQRSRLVLVTGERVGCKSDGHLERPGRVVLNIVPRSFRDRRWWRATAQVHRRAPRVVRCQASPVASQVTVALHAKNGRTLRQAVLGEHVVQTPLGRPG